jgi:hypothetical protein
MKVCLECDVDSRTYIGKERLVKTQDKIYSFFPDEKGFISRINIVLDIRNPEVFRIDGDPNESYKASKEITDALIAEMKELESMLAFTHHLKKIAWNNPQVSVLTELEEKGKVCFSRIYGLPQYPDPAKSADEESLRSLLDAKDNLSHLTVPMAFYREGLNDYHSYRYINSFINFYFILEGFYLNGAHGKKAIHEFKKSSEFMGFVDWIIKTAIYGHHERHYHLLEMLKYKSEAKKLIWVDTLIELLVKTRNELSHFQDNPKKLQGTPFNQGRFGAIAFVAFGLAYRVLLQRMAEAGVWIKEQPWAESTNDV